MPEIVVLNPIKVACPNKNCGAPANHSCKTVGKFISAVPHTPRLTVVVGKIGTAERAPRSRAAIDAYTAAVLRALIRRDPTAEEIAHAQRDGSLKPDKGWLRALCLDNGVRRARPKKRVDQHGTTTYWGAVDEERVLADGSFVVQLDTGFVLRLAAADGWSEWWPERKAEAATLGHAVPRYCFTVLKDNRVSAIDHDTPIDDSEVVMPSKRVDDRQIGLGL